MKIVGIIQSFFELTFRVVLAPRAKVLFYYPQHFNRSAEGTNPFFDAMLETCRRHNISYKLIEEPDWGTDKPRNGGAIKGDWLYVLTILLRKVASVLCNPDESRKEEYIVADLLNLFFFGKLRYDTYITISGSMQTVFAKMKKGCKAFDMQHGVLYHNHSGYKHSDGKLLQCFYSDSINWLLWGEGYRTAFLSNESNDVLNRGYVIGYPLHVTKMVGLLSESPVLLFSLQFTDDSSKEHLLALKNMVIDTLSQIQHRQFKVLLKHHPRYNNVIDMNDVYSRFSFVEETKESLSELLSQVMLQITYNSTTSFEYAEFGIPSFFLSSESFPIEKNIFYSEYKYPLYVGMSITDVLNRIQNKDEYEADSFSVRKWYDKFYSPFDGDLFLKAIKML